MTTPLQNRLFAAFPEAAQVRLLPDMEAVSLPTGMILYEPGHDTQHVYFPTDAVISMLGLMSNGATTEVAMVGNDGLAGLTLLMSGKHSPTQAIVQSTGTAYRLLAQRIRTEFALHQEMNAPLMRYIQSLLIQMAQTAACNRHHSVDQQLCRWLLMFLDRIRGNHLRVTQEQIASMLGVRRESVAYAAARLQRLGVIEYSRGLITVRRREALEGLCCECYATVRQEQDVLVSRLESDAAE